MTGERVKELMGIWGENNPKVVARACLVAAESRKEGIEEVCNSLSWQRRHGTYGRVALINELKVKRLKEKKK